MKKSPLRERVTRFSPSMYLSYAAGWSMRVWREEPLDSINNYVPGHNQIDHDIVLTLQRFIQHPVSPLDLSRAVLELERVNAVECVDLQGSGEVLYDDWP